MRTIDVRRDGYGAAAEALRRSTLQNNPKAEEVVRGIIADVQARGDAAVLELGRRFDSAHLGAIEVESGEWDRACAGVEQPMRRAIEVAAANITSFHERQVRSSWFEQREGAVVGQLIRPLRRVGVYVPGGTAVYPSSVLMCALPARAAGVADLVMCTPCRADGTVHPLVLFAARAAGVSRVFRAGGAQAIAAMAFGTETIPGVDKVVGPGNVYVNLAKRLLYGTVDIDMLAGPSEVCVVADEGADPAFAAADLLTQAEHDPECAAYLITPSAELAARVVVELEGRLADLPRRDILRRALEEHGAVVIAEDLLQACELADVCAPEHLALMVREPFALLEHIHNAGAILMGDHTPQTLGDYAAGPSHTLPTSGTARFASPLNVDTFVKKSSFIRYTPAALRDIAPTLTRLAEAEGFGAHAAAVRARTERTDD